MGDEDVLVTRAKPWEERPVGRFVAIAGLLGLLGSAIVLAAISSMSGEPTGSTPNEIERPSEEASQPLPNHPPGPAMRADSGPPSAVATEDPPSAPSPAASPENTDSSSAPSNAVVSAVTRGRLAYLRCDDAEQPLGTFPCPRDRELEDRIWAALDASSSCPQTANLRGRAIDYRLEFRRASSTSRIVGVPDDVRESLLTCIDSHFNERRTAIESSRLIISAQFSYP